MRRARVLVYLMIPIVVLLALAHSASAATPASFPQAKAWLKKMSDYMGTIDKFQVHVQSSRDVIFPNGGRITEDMYGDLFVQRPNMLRANLFRPNKIREVYYDGTTLTVFTPKLNYYGTIPVPPTIEQMLDMVTNEYGISVPMADILRPDIYSKVLPQIDSGIVVGPSLLNGVYCKQLAFRSGMVDWQIWIEDSKTPLPRRVAIVDRGVKGEPQYTLMLTEWNTAPTFDANLFKFTPPEGAQKIQFVKPGQAPPRRSRAK